VETHFGSFLRRVVFLICGNNQLTALLPTQRKKRFMFLSNCTS